MPRCGCQSVCTCVIQGRAPVTVNGNGSVQRPYVISVSQGDAEGCDAITACVANNLGPGLTYDKGSKKIQLLLSRDDGQVARFGSDNGLYVPGDGTGPGPQGCTRGISSLPEAPGVVGAYAMAGLMNPYSSPYGLDYCLENKFDVIGFQVGTCSDGVAVVCDYNDNRIFDTRTSLYISQDVKQMSSATAHSAYNYAGDVDDPRSHTPSDRDDRRGGWWGWLAQRYYQPLLGEFLHRIDGKAVALIQCYPDPESAYGTEAWHLQGAISAVLNYCAQDWTLIGIGELGSASTVLNSGLTPVLIPLQPDTWAVSEPPYPVGDVAESGVKWMVLPDYYTDSVFAAYRDAGVNVLMRGNSRHSQRARVEALGIRGGYMLDPAYYRGPTGPGTFDYRGEYDPWEHRRMGLGQLTYETNKGNVVSSSGLVRGRTEGPEQGLILPENFGRGMGRASVLCGWECPVRRPDNYTITWDMKLLSQPAGNSAIPKIGLLFGAETDADTLDWPQDDPDNNPIGFPEGQKTLYRAYQRVNGTIGLAKWESQTSDITYFGEKEGPALEIGEWNSYSVKITPTTVTFTRTVPGGSEVSISANDDQYRGPYFWIEKEETFIGEPAHPFAAKFRNITNYDHD